MRKLLIVFFVLGALGACEDQNLQPDLIQYERSDDLVLNSGTSARTSGCTVNNGGPVYPKTGTYNCHQYVRGALVLGQVNLTTGEPQAVDFANSQPGGVPAQSQFTIQGDPNFIRVCSPADAKAVAHLPTGTDHSTLMINGAYAYSFPGGTHIYTHFSPLNYSGACDYEYYAAIPDVQIQGPVKEGNNYRFTLQNKSNYSFILTDNLRWSYPTASFNLVDRTDTQLVITPKAGVSGNFSVSASLKTTANTGSCNLGVNGIEPATSYVPTRTKSFTVSPDCAGTLDNGPLYTFNTVTRNVQHKVVMNANSWTWVKTSGNATWYTAAGGKEMYFNISSGSATFNAYGSGCNITVTFYAF